MPGAGWRITWRNRRPPPRASCEPEPFPALIVFVTLARRVRTQTPCPGLPSALQRRHREPHRRALSRSLAARAPHTNVASPNGLRSTKMG